MATCRRQVGSARLRFRGVGHDGLVSGFVSVCGRIVGSLLLSIPKEGKIDSKDTFFVFPKTAAPLRLACAMKRHASNCTTCATLWPLPSTRACAAAARALGLAQPAITRSLRELERELNASLVERHARGRGTDPGRPALSGARPQCDGGSYAALARRWPNWAAAVRRMVTVAVAMSTAPMLALVPERRAKAFRQVALPGKCSLRLVEGTFPTDGVSACSMGTWTFTWAPRPSNLPRASYAASWYFKNERVVVARKRQHPLLGGAQPEGS